MKPKLTVWMAAMARAALLCTPPISMLTGMVHRHAVVGWRWLIGSGAIFREN
eukprot:SAG11_NODE_2444_length_3354_cov_2.476498_4_plen_52_part_00